MNAEQPTATVRLTLEQLRAVNETLDHDRQYGDWPNGRPCDLQDGHYALLGAQLFLEGRIERGEEQEQARYRQEQAVSGSVTVGP